MNKGILTVLIICFVLAMALTFISIQPQKTETSQTPVISNFEECAAANNPVMESYPRKCRVNGVTYTENIDIEQ